MSLLEHQTRSAERHSLRDRIRLPIPGVKGLLQKEVEAPNSEPTFDTLKDLATTLRHVPEAALEDSQEIVLKLDDTAEQLLGAVEATEERTHVPYSSLDQIWSAARAWDVARTEATEELLSHLIDHSAALTAHVALNKAFLNAKRNKRPFEEELDKYNEQQRSLN